MMKVSPSAALNPPATVATIVGHLEDMIPVFISFRVVSVLKLQEPKQMWDEKGRDG